MVRAFDFRRRPNKLGRGCHVTDDVMDLQSAKRQNHQISISIERASKTEQNSYKNHMLKINHSRIMSVWPHAWRLGRWWMSNRPKKNWNWSFWLILGGKFDGDVEIPTSWKFDSRRDVIGDVVGQIGPKSITLQQNGPKNWNWAFWLIWRWGIRVLFSRSVFTDLGLFNRLFDHFGLFLVCFFVKNSVFYDFTLNFNFSSITTSVITAKLIGWQIKDWFPLYNPFLHNFNFNKQGGGNIITGGTYHLCSALTDLETAYPPNYRVLPPMAQFWALTGYIATNIPTPTSDICYKITWHVIM